jgi:hypothetical protein
VVDLVHDTTAAVVMPAVGVAVTAVGADGTEFGLTAFDGADVVLVPFALWALTVNV